MSSPEAAHAARRDALLLDVARRSIECGARTGEGLAVDPGAFPEALREPRATFVTLHLGGELRGCVGALEARAPLVVDVAKSAFGAAFRDSRFAPVRGEDVAGLDIHIAILSPLERIAVASEAALLAALRPGVDGVVLRDGTCQGTFLPAVWERLPEPRRFVEELKRKAGLRPDHWSKTVEVSRYSVESIS